MNELMIFIRNLELVMRGEIPLANGVTVRVADEDSALTDEQLEIVKRLVSTIQA